MSSNDKPKLLVDWCSHDAAKYAVENWHYSHVMPCGKTIRIGAWENDCFIGCVIFSCGANNHIGSPYGLSQTEVCELTRVALRNHITPVSKITSLAIKFLKKRSPGIRLIVSYADPEQGHHGGIYQAMNWVYVGNSQPQRECLINNKKVHKRTINAVYGSIIGINKSALYWKHKYLYPLDNEMKVKVNLLSKPYPKRAGSKENVAPCVQQGEGGANPTPALQD